ncbi:MAG: glutathione S-transferase family protein, partial [Gammaproteobacteria bacterium]
GWYIVWFLLARYAPAKDFLSEFPALLGWAERMKAIGHGTPTPMTPAEALAIAKAAEPQSPEKSDPRDPQGLKPGMRVTVQPVTDSGERPIAGVIRAVERNSIALTREDPACGVVAVHFPRVGYRVAAVTKS